MAQEITLDTLLQGSGNEEPKRELVDAKTVQAQVEKLTPELLDKIMEESTTLQGIYLRASGFQEISYNGKSNPPAW